MTLDTALKWAGLVWLVGGMFISFLGFLWIIFIAWCGISAEKRLDAIKQRHKDKKRQHSENLCGDPICRHKRSIDSNHPMH